VLDEQRNNGIERKGWPPRWSAVVAVLGGGIEVDALFGWRYARASSVNRSILAINLGGDVGPAPGNALPAPIAGTKGAVAARRRQ